MSYIVRKINRAKWPSEPQPVDEISADAITQTLSTKQNTISFWEIDSLDELEDILLAIVTSFKHLESFDVIILEKKEIEESNIDLEPSEGLTLIEDLKDNHLDLVNLNYDKLGGIAEIVLTNILSDNCERIVRSTTKEIIGKAIEEDRISKEDLHSHVAKYY